MIRFRNWILTGEIDARQYDDYTAEFRVVGLPLGWVKWELFWNFGSHLDMFDLSMDESGTAGTVLFDKNNLAFAGIYRAQLRATNAAGGEKYTDTLELDIKPSFSEDANWPEVPSSFQDYVDSVGAQIGEKVNEIVGENISDEINEHNTDGQAHSEKFENVLRALDLALTRHNINANSHEDIRTLITNLSKSISGFETTSGASAKVSAHNADSLAHSDIRDLISTLTTRLNAVANSEDIDLDQLAELVSYIKANRGLIESITTTKVSYSDIVNDLNTNDARKPLSAQMGAELRKMIGTGGGSENVFIGTEQTLLADYKAAFDSGKACFMLRDRGTSKVMYTICQVTNNVVHLARTASSGLVEFGALSASGVLSFQIVSYATEITEANTKEDNYVPTAKAVKAAFDENTKDLKNWVQNGYAQMDDLPTVPEWASKDQKPSYTKSEVGLGNVDNVRQYSADNPPPYPVSSVNGKTGAVSLGASDVGARPNTWMPTAADVGAAPATHSHDYLPITGGTLKGTTVTVGFSHDGGDTVVNKFVAKSGEMVVYGDKILSMYTIQDGGGVYGVNIMNNYLQPNGTAASKIGLGRDGRRYLNLFLVNAANVSSDRNAKTDIHLIDERFIEMFDKLEPVSYKLIGGNHDRDHLGFISQDVKTAMDEAGISDMEFGGYCRDQKTEEVVDENGNPVELKGITDENGQPVYSYSLRYGEFIALNTKMIQLCRKEIKALRAEIEELKNKLN